MADGTPRRLDADRRKASILDAAQRLLAEKGLPGFSLEAVAREAGVALSLPRHHFGSSRDLLRAAFEALLPAVETGLLHPGPGPDLAARLAAHLEFLARHPWAHQVWMRAADLHPEIHAAIRQARRVMAELIFQQPWPALSRAEQLDALGLIGYVEAVLTDWLEQGGAARNSVGERALVVDLILAAMTRTQAFRCAGRGGSAEA